MTRPTDPDRRETTLEAPARHDAGGYRGWSSSSDGAEVRFVGRGPAASLPEVVAVTSARKGSGRDLEVAWARQVHSARVIAARPGECGEGDALWTTERNLALAVGTADCVPVLLAGDGVAAAIHAGWRGLASGILAETVHRLPVKAGGLMAWIGPSIGACCYEVDDVVAARVVERSGAAISRPGPRGRPHLDLVAAARAQLASAGLVAISTVATCTRCDHETLFSFRRDGTGGGRNVAYVWLV